MKKNKPKIVISKNGPYIVSGNIPLAKEKIANDTYGVPLTWKKGEKYPDQEIYSLCRCGKTKTPPYCDQTHTQINFDGSETAPRKTYQEQAKTTPGPKLDLTDVIPLCAFAKFCLRAGDTWTLTEHSDDPTSKETAIQEASDCPSGRLVAWEKSGKAIEPGFDPSISLVEIPGKKISGPLWVKGGIPIESSDGTPYEIRNRVTLCRCGKSSNKPFCDGTHIVTRFKV